MYSQWLKTSAGALALTALLTASHGAYAQDASATSTEDAEARQETVTVTGSVDAFGATKTDIPIVETARSVSVEPEDVFIERGALNLSQTVSYVTGVTAETYGFSTRGDWVSSRGLSIPRYRDSIQELFGSYNTTRVEPWTVEQVEILRGPASVLYGQGSPGGLLNVVSKTPEEDFGGSLAAELGNFERYQIAGDVTGPVPGSDGQLLYRLVGLYRNTGSQVDYVDEESGVFMPSLTWIPSEDTRLTIIGIHQDTKGDVAAQFIPVEGTLFPHNVTGEYIDQDVYAGEPDFNFFDTKSDQITLLGEHRVNDVWNIEATALWRSGEADYQQAWPTFTGAGQSRYLNQYFGAPLFTETTVARTFYAADNTSEQYALDLRARADFTTGSLTHNMLMGAQYQDVETDSNTAYYLGGGVLSGDFSYVFDLANPVYGNYPDQSVLDAIYSDGTPQQVQDLGLYVSDQIALDDWRFTLGLRYDQVENDTGAVVQDDDAVSTSFGVLYRFDNGLAPYASYSESFEPVIGTDLAGNQLDPEEARQYEFGLKYEPQSFPGLITLAYYDIEISNLPNPNALPNDAAQQQGISTLRGLELEARMQLDNVFLQFAASTIDAEDPDGFKLPGQPNGTASAWATWRPEGALNGFRIGGGIRYVGESVAEDGTVRYVTPDYTLGDLMIGYEWDRWDFQINARNIADEEYLTSCLTRGDCFPGLRRTVVARLAYEFGS
ncbi:TonB-dependent siderophore receptor [Ponticaulis sp.]|uniref:TonB-dependent siderophore receptor n=1 Tax=Ponticaulis sp. TaxID=2020902 RepID=UPI000B758FE2|nr:TonB-dependent siderophore receptor [Ponticaulis sp.]MAI90513.1 TonB-dependent siderophore receptor [Ponticaulis sp.]OUY00304.1 MAG: TonB-dependent siderophore receptor [Hyphomonadaceae bacterium TMED5]